MHRERQSGARRTRVFEESERRMDRLFANGTVNAAEIGKGPPLFLFHSLLSDRASFDAIVPQLSQSFRVIVPELPGFGKSRAAGDGLADIADRMAEAVSDAANGEDAVVLGNGYGGFVALQMAIRHPGIASRLVLADCGAAFSEPGRQAFRNMAAAASAKGLAAITDVAMRRLFAWVAGVALFAFAWVGRSIATGEASVPSLPNSPGGSRE